MGNTCMGECMYGGMHVWGNACMGNACMGEHMYGGTHVWHTNNT